MKNLIAFLFSILSVIGCASTDYQPYEGKNNVYEGDGGTKVTVNGVDFWANGTPPRKYAILGMVVSEIGGGVGDEYLIRSAVSGEVKRHGGDAAIQINDNKSFSGIVRTSPGVYMAASVKKMQFAIVRYLQ